MEQSASEIRNGLKSKKMLATMSFTELLDVADDSDKFGEFIIGVGSTINPFYVCFAYKYYGILSRIIDEHINVNYNIEETLSMRRIRYWLGEYDCRDAEYKYDFSTQYCALESSDLGINRLKISIEDMNRHLLDMFDAIDSGQIESVKLNKYYLVTVGYLIKYHPVYLRNSEALPQIVDSLIDVQESDFSCYEDYQSFKKVARKQLRKIRRVCEIPNEKSKVYGKIKK